jgi:hypothetical protein
MSNLQAAFEAFASFGAGPQTEMDNAKFIKLCKEAGLIDTKFTTTDADLLFSKIKAKGARKITFSQFADLALPEIATKKKSTPEAIAAQVQAASPQARATVADAVRFHDDKSAYTGVYKAGGPSTIDRDSANLSGIVDRRVSADVRGVTDTQKSRVNA